VALDPGQRLDDDPPQALGVGCGFEWIDISLLLN
jgi:hypothetical protein